MIKPKMKLEELLASSAEKSILLLGKEGRFTKEEIARFLKPYKMSLASTLQEDHVVAVVEHPRLTPVEEMVSEEAYEVGVPLYKLADFEKLLSQNIDEDALLMGVKLSNDMERVVRLLGNEHISDTLFVRLLKLYRFSQEEDNRADRDVIVHTLRRYIAINPNEEDLLQSYLTLRRLATEATDEHLLEALMGFPNFSFLVRGKEKVTLKETIARNPHIGKESVIKLLGLRDAKVDASLAGNPAVSLEVLHQLEAKGDDAVAKALAVNPAIDDALFATLLQRGGEVTALLLVHQPIDNHRLAIIKEVNLASKTEALLGLNESLEATVRATLLAEDEVDLLGYLAANPTISAEEAEVLWQRDEESLFAALAANKATPRWILEALYEGYDDQLEIMQGLGRNPNTPPSILHALYAKDRLEINRALATNASLPDEILDVLKLDTRLQTELAQNERLASSFEAVLKQGKVMLNI